MLPTLRSYFVIPLLLILGGPALGADRYVSPSGSGTSCSSGSPCALSYANQHASAGDRVILASGTYSDPIEPESGGTSSSRITYMGAQGSPSAAVVPGVFLGGIYGCGAGCANNKGDYTTVKWVKSTESVEVRGELWNSARRYANSDSILNITIDGSDADLVVSAHRAIVQNVTMNGNHLHLASQVPDNNYAPINQYSQHNKLTDCNVTLVPTTASHVFYSRTALHDTLERCRISAKSVDNVTGDARICGFYNCKDFIIKDVWFEITNDDDDCQYGFNLRDSCRFNIFDRDTVIVQDGLAAKTPVYLANSGTLAAVKYNRFSNCIFKHNDAGDGTGYHSPGTWQDGPKADIVEFCSFIAGAGQPAITLVSQIGDSTIFRHNTFFTSGDEVVKLQDVSSVGSSTKFVSNVLYSKTAPTASAGGTLATFGMAFAAKDTNLYFYSGSSGSQNCSGGSPHDSCRAVWNGSSALSPSGYATRSYWASPRFVDSTFNATDITKPNVRALSTSWATGAVWVDGYVGALAPPSPVTDLAGARGCEEVILSWTAPGAHASYGTASQYDLRMSDSNITEGNFYAAEQVAVDYPSASGSAEECHVSLEECTTKYFALKTRDANYNWSSLSNVVQKDSYCPPPPCSPPRPGFSRPAAAGTLSLVTASPSRGPLRLQFGVPADLAGQHLELAIFDVAGRRIATILEAPARPGIHETEWSSDGRAGMVFIRLKVGAAIVRSPVVALP